MARLHEPIAEIARLNELAESGFSDIEAVREVLAVRRESKAVCVDRLLAVCQYYRGRIAEIEKLKDDCTDEINRCKNRLDKIREYVGSCMDAAPGETFEGSSGRFVRRNNGGKLAINSDYIFDKKSFSNIVPADVSLPAALLNKVEFFTVNMDAVRSLLESGELVPGFRLADRGSYIKDEV